jgi:hypothetical protein
MRWLLVLLVACSSPSVRVHYPTVPDQPTGTLVILLSQEASDVTVAVNGNLICDHTKTDRVIVDGVPVGTQTVAISANGMDKAFSIWVSDDHWTTVPLGIPDQGVGFLKTLAGSILTIVVYSLLH